MNTSTKRQRVGKSRDAESTCLRYVLVFLECSSRRFWSAHRRLASSGASSDKCQAKLFLNSFLGDDVFDHFAVDVRQPEIAAGITVRKLLVVQT